MATTVAVLGTGRMGAPMGVRMLGAGLDVRAWNRSPEKTKPLVDAGAVACATAAEAVRGADVVVTMLSDGPTVEAVMSGGDGGGDGDGGGALAAAGPGVVWAQMSTVGVEWTDRLAAGAAARGVEFVDAPVSGSDEPARTGTLVVFAAGSERARAVVTPVFEAVGRATRWLGEAGMASRMKLVANNWIVNLVEATAETLTFADGLGLDLGAVVDFFADSPIGSPYAVQKARAMVAGDTSPHFSLALATKDAALAADAAAAAGVELPLTAVALPRWRAAIDAGRGELDLSAVYERRER